MAQKQRPHDPVCEFEIECLHPMRYRQHHGQQYKFVAESLLRKMLGFLPPGGTTAEDYYLPKLMLRQIMDLDTTGVVVPVWRGRGPNGSSVSGVGSGRNGNQPSSPPPKRHCR